MQGTPRMPWFWPGRQSAGYTPERFDETQRAFQAALNMRYTFLPFMYSLAHVAHRHFRPIGHPASFAFPVECADPASQRCADAQRTYMVGSVLLPSDLGLAHTNTLVDTPTGKLPSQENSSTAILPGATSWFRWNTTVVLSGGQMVKETLALDEMSLFVCAGSILPLQAGGPIQHSAQAGGTLELQVYGGGDGSFEMVEDDGISLEYEANPGSATRTTMWRWDHAAKTLTWSVQGGATLSSPNLYTSVVPVLFDDGAAAWLRAAIQTLGERGGKVVFALSKHPPPPPPPAVQRNILCRAMWG